MRRGLGRGFWALADQGLVSLATFSANILLSRQLPSEDYGVYTILVGAILIANGMHSALVVYPLSVEGAEIAEAAPGRPEAALTARFLLVTLALALPLGAALAAPAFLMGQRHAALWVLPAVLFWQCQETCRRGLMARFRHRAALWGDGIGYGGQVAVLGGLMALGERVGLDEAFAAMALCFALGALVQGLQLGLWRERALPRLTEFPATIRASWRFGRWMLLTGMMATVSIQAYSWVLAWWQGLPEAASWRAVINLVSFAHPVMFGLSNVIVPATARARAEAGIADAQRVALRYAGQGAMLLLPLFAALSIWPAQALLLFYGEGSPYVALSSALRVVVFVYALSFIAQALSGLLNGLRESRCDFIAQCCGAATSLAFGLPLAAGRGVMGASLGSAASLLVRNGVGLRLLRRMR